MQKGESFISIAMAVVVVLLILGIQQKWQPASLKDVASSAEEFILETTGIRGQIADIQGYEKVKTFRLGRYRAALYRATPAPAIFTGGLFVVYNQDDHPAFELETLEGSKDSWTELYDFSSRHSRPWPGSRTRPEYTRNLTGNGNPDIIVGQYSGGDHCCTTATVVELAKDTANVLSRIDGLVGSPFDGLELRKAEKGPAWEIIAHRPMATSCGSEEEAADILSIYSYDDGQYTDQTPQFRNIVEAILRQNLAKWQQEETRSLQLLQTLAVNYALLGQRDEARRFVSSNLPKFAQEFQKKSVDPRDCQDDLGNLLANLPRSPAQP